MSWSINALVLMHLDARPGTWCTAENIAATLELELAECEASCNELSAAGVIQGHLDGDGRANAPRYSALAG